MDEMKNPEEWLTAFLETVPERHRESMGQMQAIREYGDFLRSCDEDTAKRLGDRFDAALARRFGPRPDPVPVHPVKPRKTSVDEDAIFERMCAAFSAPEDGSAHRRQVLFARAMGIMRHELAGVPLFTRGRVSFRLRLRLKTWVEENLP